MANLPDRLFLYRKNFNGTDIFETIGCSRKAGSRPFETALVRRGLDPHSAPERPPFIPKSAPDTVWAIWANRALVAGHRDTARHYAIKAFCAAPQRHWSYRSGVWLGIRSQLWARCRRAISQRHRA